MREMGNVLVVGGGLAGCACALRLKRRGAAVTLIERHDLQSKSKLCGGLMTPRSIALAQELFGARLEPLFGLDFGEMLCVTGKRETMLHGLELRSLHRKDLDDLAMGLCLEAGVAVFDNCELKDIDVPGRTAIAERSSGERLEFSYDALVAADGALSAIRRLFTGAATPGVLSLEAEVEANPSQPLTMLYDARLHGYCWYIPRGMGRDAKANVGCVSYVGAKLDEVLAAFAQRVGVSYAERRGAFIPTGEGVLLQHGDVRFVGDASGLICPVTGEGIYYALASAKACAYSIETGASYSCLMDEHVRTVDRELKTRELFYSKRFIDVSLGAATRTPYGAERAIKFALKHFASF